MDIHTSTNTAHTSVLLAASLNCFAKWKKNSVQLLMFCELICMRGKKQVRMNRVSSRVKETTKERSKKREEKKRSIHKFFEIFEYQGSQCLCLLVGWFFYTRIGYCILCCAIFFSCFFFTYWKFTTDNTHTQIEISHSQIDRKGRVESSTAQTFKPSKSPPVQPNSFILLFMQSEEYIDSRYNTNN